MTFEEILRKRAELFDEMKAFLEKNCAENGLLSAENDEKYSKMEAELDAFDREVKRFEDMEKRDKAMREPAKTVIKNAPDGKTDAPAAENYSKAFYDAVRSKFRVISDEMQEKVDADGGYLVPETLDKKLITELNENNFMRGLATVFTTASDIILPAEESVPEGQWVGEGAEITFGKPQFSQVKLTAHKLVAATKITDELLRDSVFNLESYIAELFGRVLAESEEKAFLTGDGENQPTGIFDATSGGTAAGTVESKSLKADNIIDLFYALERPYRKRAAFIMHDSNVALVRKLKDGNGAYLWQPALTSGEPDRILGVPLYTSPFAPKDAIAVGDMSYYRIGDRATRSLKIADQLFLVNDMVGFVMKERVDGKLTLKKAVQILKVTSD